MQIAGCGVYQRGQQLETFGIEPRKHEVDLELRGAEYGVEF